MSVDRVKLAHLVEYLRAEADFNRSWVDGRRGADRDFPDAYKRRRIELAEERDGWADAIGAALDEIDLLQRATIRVVELTPDNCNHNREIDPDTGMCGDCWAVLP